MFENITLKKDYKPLFYVLFLERLVLYSTKNFITISYSLILLLIREIRIKICNSSETDIRFLAVTSKINYNILKNYFKIANNC